MVSLERCVFASRLTRPDIRLYIESAEHTGDFGLCGRDDWNHVGIHPKHSSRNDNNVPV